MGKNFLKELAGSVINCGLVMSVAILANWGWRLGNSAWHFKKDTSKKEEA